MIETLKKWLGGGPKADLAALVRNGAQIIDVRTPEEFRSGHIAGSVNIPLGNLSSAMSKLDKNRVIITCCASGMRSASAKNQLKSKGFLEVHNGGGWHGLQAKIG